MIENTFIIPRNTKVRLSKFFYTIIDNKKMKLTEIKNNEVRKGVRVSTRTYLILCGFKPERRYVKSTFSLAP